MPKQLFPEEFINSSIEHYTFKVQVSTKWIYVSVAFVFIAFLVSLPFIPVEISKNASGQVMSNNITHSLVSPVGAQVSYVDLQENQKVIQGDTLLKFQSTSIRHGLTNLNRRKAELESFIKDLDILIQKKSDSIKFKFKTSRYEFEFEEYLVQLGKLKSIEIQAEKSYSRQKLLYDEKVIAEKDLEVVHLRLKNAISDSYFYKKQKKLQWQKEQLALQNELRALDKNLTQTQNLLQHYFLLAPTTGYLQRVRSIHTGQVLLSGDPLAEISPTDSLVAQCYIPTTDIGLIKEGQRVSFRIDAFNYNEWGMVEGTVQEIARDVTIGLDKIPLFRVKCELHQNYLSLNNGFRGELQKGMTLQGSFLIKKRSLFQLLYEDIMDWLDPQVKQNKTL